MIGWTQRSSDGVVFVVVRIALQGVRAVVNYKWNRYARRVMVAQLVCFVVWLLSFTGFVMLMNYGSRPAPGSDPGWHGPAWPGAAYAMLALSTALMVPFALLELRTIWVYRFHYARRTVVADLMDLIILANHAAIIFLVLNNALYEPTVGGAVDIDILIAVQATLLWAKLPYFFRCVDTCPACKCISSWALKCSSQNLYDYFSAK